MTKPEVREVARQHGLALAEKPDSQEICFIPGGDYKQFLTAYLEEQGEAMPDTTGELVASSGEVLGHHDGISNFTVGQRKGLKVSVAVAALRAATSIRRAIASPSAPTPSSRPAPCVQTASTGSAFPNSPNPCA